MSKAFCVVKVSTLDLHNYTDLPRLIIKKLGVSDLHKVRRHQETNGQVIRGAKSISKNKK